MNYYYDAEITNFTDSSTFGSLLPGRSFGSESYRYGAFGYEKVDEVKGSGNHYTTKDRGYDPRLGRWWSVDPKASLQPWQSPYNYMDGNPVAKNDPDGDCPTCIFGAIVGAAVDYGVQVATNAYNNGGLTTEAFTENINLTSIAVVAGEGFLTSGASVGKTILVKTTAAVVNNIVEVKTTKNGLKANVETNAVNVVKNAAIDLTVDALTKDLIPSKTITKQLSKAGFNKGQVAKKAKDGLKSLNVDVTRKVNQNVTKASEKVVNAVNKAPGNVAKVVTNKSKDNAKAKTNRKSSGKVPSF